MLTCKMLFGWSQWIFSKYNFFIIFYYRLLNILMIKVVYWHVLSLMFYSLNQEIGIDKYWRVGFLMVCCKRCQPLLLFMAWMTRTLECCLMVSMAFFSVKSAYNMMCNYPGIVDDSSWNKIWRYNTPEWVRYFVWLLRHGRLMTNYRKTQNEP
jgi:hypothetical protein